MNLKQKLNIRKAIIVFPIVLVLVGSSLIGVFSAGWYNDMPVSNNTNTSDDTTNLYLEDLVKNETALKIFEIYDDLDTYLDKEISLEGYFLNYGEDIEVFGVEFHLTNGDLSFAPIPYEVNDPHIIKDLSDTDLVLAKGTIDSYEEIHEDETRVLPKFIIDSIEVIR